MKGIRSNAGIPGSARVSRVDDGVSAIADFSKDCFGETSKPTRETRALPRVRVISRRKPK
jgi:hypothetical protein